MTLSPAAAETCLRDGMIMPDAGWPRPWVDDPEFGRMPVPYVTPRHDNEDLTVEWIDLRDDAPDMVTQRRCVVCGLEVAGPIVFAAVGRLYTNGPGGHAACQLLALRYCPTLNGAAQDTDLVAYSYTGPGTGLASDNPSIILEGGVDLDRSCQPLTLTALKKLAVTSRPTPTSAGCPMHPPAS